jgi:hypothetical protein
MDVSPYGIARLDEIRVFPWLAGEKPFWIGSSRSIPDDRYLANSPDELCLATGHDSIRADAWLSYAWLPYAL